MRERQLELQATLDRVQIPRRDALALRTSGFHSSAVRLRGDDDWNPCSESGRNVGLRQRRRCAGASAGDHEALRPSGDGSWDQDSIKVLVRDEDVDSWERGGGEVGGGEGRFEERLRRRIEEEGLVVEESSDVSLLNCFESVEHVGLTTEKEQSHGQHKSKRGLLHQGLGIGEV